MISKRIALAASAVALATASWATASWAVSGASTFHACVKDGNLIPGSIRVGNPTACPGGATAVTWSTSPLPQVRQTSGSSGPDIQREWTRIHGAGGIPAGEATIRFDATFAADDAIVECRLTGYDRATGSSLYVLEGPARLHVARYEHVSLAGYIIEPDAAGISVGTECRVLEGDTVSVENPYLEVMSARSD